MEWKQERPEWCKHWDCLFLRRAMDSTCGGKLPVPEKHDMGYNTHRLCMRFEDNGQVIDTQVNDTDLEWLRWIFDALDGKSTSWLSNSAKRYYLDFIKREAQFLADHLDDPNLYNKAVSIIDCLKSNFHINKVEMRGGR